MRVCLLGPGIMEIPPDGYGAVEKHIWKLAVELRHLGHEVDIWNKPVGEYWWTLGVLRRMRGDANGYDILHAHTSFLAGFLSAMYPLIYTSHSPLWTLDSPGPIERWGLFWERRAVRQSRNVIALTSSMASHFGLVHRIHVIPNGVDTGMFRPDTAARRGDRVCMLGKVVARKNMHRVAAALRDVDCELHVIGPHPDPEYAQTLIRVNGRIWFHDGLSESAVAKLLSAMDVFVHASETEAMSMAVLEAMASGLPILGSWATEEQLGGAGLVIPMDADEIRKHVLALLQNAELRNRLGALARERAESSFSWGRVAERTVGVYRAHLADLSS